MGSISIDDQPISATFFEEGKWLTDFVTPEALEVKTLHDELTGKLPGTQEKLSALHNWVGQEVKYVRFVRATMWINGKRSAQNDYWQTPSQAIRTKIGNCANKAFLLTSLVRNSLSSDQAYVVLGNLNQPPEPGGHAWVQVSQDGQDYIMESTRGDMKPLVAARVANVYESVLYFNDKEIKAIEGRTLLQPFTAVYADWLKDYLDWAYIEGRK